MDYFQDASISWQFWWTLGCIYLFELVFLVFFFFFDIYSGVEMPGHVVVLFLGFWETSLLFSIVAAPVYIPAISIPFLHILTNIYIQ